MALVAGRFKAVVSGKPSFGRIPWEKDEEVPGLKIALRIIAEKIGFEDDWIALPESDQVELERWYYFNDEEKSAKILESLSKSFDTTLDSLEALESIAGLECVVVMEESKKNGKVCCQFINNINAKPRPKLSENALSKIDEIFAKVGK